MVMEIYLILWIVFVIANLTREVSLKNTLSTILNLDSRPTLFSSSPVQLFLMTILIQIASHDTRIILGLGS